MENKTKNKKIKHIHLSLTDTEVYAIEKYCNENAIIFGQLVRRLVLQEIQQKSTISHSDFIPPITDCLKRGRK